MTANQKKKLLIVDVAGLGYGFLQENHGTQLNDLVFHPAESVFPALTCTVQASFRTASRPAEHGMIANGTFFRELSRPMFWEQSSTLVKGNRIWDTFRRQGHTVGLLFWQQSLGEEADLLLSPAPIHKHGGGMIDDCYSKPGDLYERLCRRVGRRFKLHQYWGPLATARVGDWIVSATVALLEDRPAAPDLLLTYLPSLDYDLQRYGPNSKRSRKALQITMRQLKRLTQAAKAQGYQILIFGDYEIGAVSQEAIFPNQALSKAGLMNLRQVKQRMYPDIYASKAFAMVDHEIAHVYIKDPDAIPAAKEVLSRLPGLAQVLDKQAQEPLGLKHANSGELVLVAEAGTWFAYPWWEKHQKAPDYAGHVDIHNKPGFDPCELFFGWPPGTVCRVPSRIGGSHGRVDSHRRVAYAASFSFNKKPHSIIDLAGGIKAWLDSDDEKNHIKETS